MSWFLKTVYDKYLLNFSDFLKFLRLIKFKVFSSQDRSPDNQRHHPLQVYYYKF